MNRRIVTAAVTGIVLAGAATAAFAATSPTTLASSYNALTSTRILDTRTGLGETGGKAPLTEGKTITLDLPGVPSGATAVVLNLTETNATGGGYLFAYADGTTQPASGSNLNFGIGQTQANQVTVPLNSGDTKVVVYSGAISGSVDVIADLEGYYTPAAPAYVPPTATTWTAPVQSGGLTIATGGSALTNAKLLDNDGSGNGSVTLTAGTYQVSVNAKATPPAGGTGTVDVFPQFFVYSQKINSDWTGDEFNVGSGALESGVNDTIDSYFSGSGTITVPAGGETLYVYAFGYDSDKSAGSYTLDSATLTAVPLAAGQ